MVIDGAVFQAGDVVMTLRNNARLDVRNGERGTLTSIDKRARSMTIQMNDRTVTLPSMYLDAGHVTHGYAMTIHKAQGLTVDRAFVLGTDDLYREMGYVAMSRGRLGNHLYVVAEPTREIEPLHGPSLERTNEENLVAALATSKAQTMASAQINPLAELDDRELVASWRELSAWVDSIPLDQSRAVSGEQADVNRLERRLNAAETRLARELDTRRSVRDTLARRDDRGHQTGWEVRQIGDELNDARRRLSAASALGNERDRKLAARPQAVADRDALDNEINRRVGEIVELQLADPAEYIETHLGAQPDHGRRHKSWTTGVTLIERFRFEHGITDPDRAFGNEDPPWLLAMRLDHIHHEIAPSGRSHGMRM